MILQPAARPVVSAYGFGPTAVRLQEQQREPLLRMANNRTVVEILRVGKRQDDWDGYGSAKPSDTMVARAVAEAVSFIEEAFAAGLEWQHPLVGSNEEGEVSFEWWRGVKKLTIYVGAHENNFVSSWGSNIDTHMHAGVLGADEFVKQWRWFTT